MGHHELSCEKQYREYAQIFYHPHKQTVVHLLKPIY